GAYPGPDCKPLARLAVRAPDRRPDRRRAGRARAGLRGCDPAGCCGGQAMTFDDEFRARLHDLIVWRRDVRRFRVEALPPGTLDRLIALACLAPSVGLSQPWRFVAVDDPARRAGVRKIFHDCNAA